MDRLNMLSADFQQFDTPDNQVTAAELLILLKHYTNAFVNLKEAYTAALLECLFNHSSITALELAQLLGWEQESVSMAELVAIFETYEAFPQIRILSWLVGHMVPEATIAPNLRDEAAAFGWVEDELKTVLSRFLQDWTQPEI